MSEDVRAGFQPNYFPAVAVASLILLVVAGLVAARRASRIDPMVALQSEYRSS